MKPIKNSVAVVIKDQQDNFLVVKRPKDENGPLAGVWGFPAITLKQGETEEEAVNRVGQAKLGVKLKVLAKIGEKVDDRGNYILHLSDYSAEIINNAKPVVPQADSSMTQYTDLKYVNNPEVLFPAAQKGSLCSQIYLQSIASHG